MHRFRLITIGLSLFAISQLLGGNPQWWTASTTQIIDPNASHEVTENYAIANLGQLKKTASQAKRHLEETLGSAGPEIETMISAFSNDGDNYVPINLGQLKSVAKPFYNRLREVGYDTQTNLVSHGYAGAGIYPWNSGTAQGENYAPANLGQVKMAFSFDLAGFQIVDTDGDGAPNAWETAHGLNPNSALDRDTDGDGISNYDEYLRGSNPADFWNGQNGMLTVISGNNQGNLSGSNLGQPLKVKLGNHAGKTKAGLSVGFNIVSPTGGGSLLTPATATTDANGFAQSSLKLPTAAAGTVVTVNAAAQGASVSFTETVGDPVQPPLGPEIARAWLYERFDNIAGNTVGNLQAAPTFPGQPTARFFVTTADSPRDQANDFGSRLRGYIVVPMAGVYKFVISADDQAELWLGLSGTPAGMQRVAWVTGSTSWRQWTKYPEQTSTSLTLTAGQKLYVEVLHKEQRGGDSVSVGWIPPGSTTAKPLSPSVMLAEGDPTIDTDGDHLPDAWEIQYFGDLSATATGDPDQDGLTNLQEAGMEDSNPNALRLAAGQGQWLYEFWSGIPGRPLSALRADSRYPNKPSGLFLLATADAPQNRAESFGARITGYIEIPITGTYRFGVAGDDNTELSISVGGLKASQEMVATVKTNTWTLFREWTKYPEQVSEPFYLQAGQIVSVEVLHKEEVNLDNASVGWIKPGAATMTPIDPSAMRAAEGTFIPNPYGPDSDRDGLPDAWEIAPPPFGTGTDPYDATSDNSTIQDYAKFLRVSVVLWQKLFPTLEDAAGPKVTWKYDKNPGNADNHSLSFYMGSSLVITNLINTDIGLNAKWTDSTLSHKEIFLPRNQFSSFSLKSLRDGLRMQATTQNGNLIPNHNDTYRITLYKAGLLPSTINPVTSGLHPSIPDVHLSSGRPSVSYPSGEPNPQWADFRGKFRYSQGEDNKWSADMSPYAWKVYVDGDPDRDGDGLSDAQEIDVTHTRIDNPDSDGDEMPDGWEVRFALDPQNSSDALTDLDLDGLTNLDEYRNGSDPQKPDSDGDGLRDDWEVYNGSDPSANTAIYDVDPSQGATSSTDRIFSTIQEAVTKKQVDGGSSALIRIKAGTYKESVRLDSANALILGVPGPNGQVVELQSQSVAPGNAPPTGYEDSQPIDATLSVYDSSVINGIVICHALRKEGRGINVANNGTAPPRFVNCVVRGNRADEGAGAKVVGAAIFVHCTFTDNVAQGLQSSVLQKDGRIELTNCIVWNQSASREIRGNGTLVARHSDVRGGASGTGNINIAPQLTPEGWLTSSSPVKDIAESTDSRIDIHGEVRPHSGADLGADEFVDTNADSLPDWWSRQYFTGESVTTHGNPDNDGVDNLSEYANGFNPKLADEDLDGLNDAQELALGTDAHRADTDWDGMPDKYESLEANGLNPLVDDAFSDNDRDRWPNIFEYKHGTKVNEAGQAADPTNVVVHPPVFTVDSTLAANDVAALKYTTIQGAVDAAKAPQNGQLLGRYSVIKVKSGVYPEAVTLSDIEILLLSDSGHQAPPEIRRSTSGSTLKINSPAVVDGFVIAHSPGVTGWGVNIFASPSDSTLERRLLNCVVRNNDYGSGNGGGIYSRVASARIIHTTLVGNKAGVGKGLYVVSGEMEFTNSISWNEEGGGTEIYAPEGAIKVTKSIVRSGEYGALNQEPLLNSLGFIAFEESAAIDAAEILPVSSSDILGVSRLLDWRPDIGAQEYQDLSGDRDNDGLTDEEEISVYLTNPDNPDSETEPDGMPDGWEVQFSLLPLSDDSTGDPDGDGLNNLAEWQHGTNPRVEDSDGDGLTDGSEVNGSHTSPTLVDTDGDGMADAWELTNELNPLINDALANLDGDNANNLQEFLQGRDPGMADDPELGNSSIALKVFTPLNRQ